uniref:Uncharacterized protein n=1 Tax=Caenorhabditis japonica TaxID=281687 RepID=A0A8R1IBC1_CAEJA
MPPQKIRLEHFIHCSREAWNIRIAKANKLIGKTRLPGDDQFHLLLIPLFLLITRIQLTRIWPFPCNIHQSPRSSLKDKFPTGYMYNDVSLGEEDAGVDDSSLQQ